MASRVGRYPHNPACVWMIRKRGFFCAVLTPNPVRSALSGGQTMRTFDFFPPTSYDHLRRIETSNSLFLTMSLEGSFVPSRDWRADVELTTVKREGL
jgi:hypothetical protein